MCEVEYLCQYKVIHLFKTYSFFMVLELNPTSLLKGSKLPLNDSKLSYFPVLQEQNPPFCSCTRNIGIQICQTMSFKVKKEKFHQLFQ
jgi:hypothetical protein